MTEKNKAYFVTSKNFHGDEGYFHWLKEIKSRYQWRKRSIPTHSEWL